MARSERRFDSLIPLSREHHYALVLCLRIHRAVPQHRTDLDWLMLQTRKALRFFETSLREHFYAEETIVFPAMSNITEASLLITTLLEEHARIRSGAERLAELQTSTEPSLLANALIEWADLLEQHIRKEERQLFPSYQEQIASDIDAKVGEEILKLIGTAMKPKHPELLQ